VFSARTRVRPAAAPEHQVLAAAIDRTSGEALSASAAAARLCGMVMFR
jgi:hypothetical protein